MRKQYFFICVSMISAILLGCDTSSPDIPKLTEVSTISIQSQKVILKEQLSGRTKASLISEIRPRVDGIIQDTFFVEGSLVTKGQILYKIDDESYKATYDEAKATLEKSEAALTTAQNKNIRYQSLVKANSVSKQDVDDVTAAYKQALGSYDAAKAALDLAKINLARTEVKAPIDGYIGISNVTVGALVTANQTDALNTIRNIETIYVDIPQSSNQLLRLRNLLAQKDFQQASTDVELKLDDDSIYPEKGVMQLQEVAVDEATGSVTLRAIFNNPNRILLPGMFVRAIVNNATNDHAILIPQRCVIRNSKSEPTIFVVTENNQIEQRTITVGQTIEDQWLVLSGVKEGEQVVVEGINKVNIGDTVSPVPFETTSSKSSDTQSVAQNMMASDKH